MAFKEARIENELKGLPRQPVPLRLVPLITDWSVAELSQILSERIDDNYELLTAHEYKIDKKTGTVRRNDLKERLASNSDKLSLKEAIEQIPPAYFVWSDELAQAFTAHIDRHMERNDAIAQGLTLNWSPALGDVDHLIEQCPSFGKILPPNLQQLNKRELGKEVTQEMYRKWYERDKQLQSSNQNLSVTGRALKIAKEHSDDPGNKKTYSDSYIRRQINEYRKNLGK